MIARIFILKLGTHHLFFIPQSGGLGMGSDCMCNNNNNNNNGYLYSAFQGFRSFLKALYNEVKKLIHHTDAHMQTSTLTDRFDVVRRSPSSRFNSEESPTRTLTSNTHSDMDRQPQHLTQCDGAAQNFNRIWNRIYFYIFVDCNQSPK